MDASKLLKEKKFWFASILVVWAAALQGHMIWIKKQDAFKQKFGDPIDAEEDLRVERGKEGKKNSELLED